MHLSTISLVTGIVAIATDGASTTTTSCGSLVNSSICDFRSALQNGLGPRNAGVGTSALNAFGRAISVSSYALRCNEHTFLDGTDVQVAAALNKYLDSGEGHLASCLALRTSTDSYLGTRHVY
jgi:hypothetical protein